MKITDKRRYEVKAHVYKIEMERLRKKLTRVYKRLYSDAYMTLLMDNANLPYTDEELADAASSYAKDLVDFYKKL